MTALTRPYTMMTPLKVPVARPTASAATIPSAALVLLVNTIAETTEVSPAADPTEMSKPPSSMTTVCTTARIPTIATDVPMVLMLVTRKKFEFWEPMTAHSTISATMRLRFCTPIMLNTRRSGLLRRSAGPCFGMTFLLSIRVID